MFSAARLNTGLAGEDSAILQRMGFNRGTGYGLLARSWGAVAAPVTMLAIATRLSREQQGFYYTFNSLLAMQLFFELGLASVIAQFASHEFARLRWTEAGGIDGDRTALRRVDDLLRKGGRWFAAASALLMLLLVPGGLLFFGRDGAGFAWKLPWALAVAGIAANLLLVPVHAVILGSGDVVTAYRRELVGGVVGSLLAWAVLFLDGGLFAAPALTLGTASGSLLYLRTRKPFLFRRILNGIREEGDAVSWRNEVWPLQWRSALSWMSGYFVFQLFVPVVFHYYGAVRAGQMGMTLALANGILGIGITWLVSSSPRLGRLIALAEWKELDLLFGRVATGAVAVVAAGLAAGYGAILFLQGGWALGERFLSAREAGVLLLSVLVLIVINALCVYVRAHKKEPFAGLMVGWALVQGALTWGTAKYVSTFGVVTASFLVSLLLVLPWAGLIWNRCRRAWHAP